MKYFICSDHAGFELKEKIKKYFAEKGITFIDVGCDSAESCEYPDFAHALAKEILKDPKNSRGIAVCGTGQGMAMALNRHHGIRAARCLSVQDAELARKHNDANALTLGARQTDFEKALQIIEVFFKIPFEGGRHLRRVEKIEA